MSFKNWMSILIILILLLPQINCKAQIETKKNNINTQLLGNGLIVSLNYERQIVKNLNLRIHAGAGFYGREKQFLTIPIGLTYLMKLNNKSSLDYGIGMTYTKAEAFYYVCFKLSSTYIENQPHYIVIPSFQYRYQPNENVFIRFGFTPVITNMGFIPMVGFSCGYPF